MHETLRRLALGLTLIVAASALLLVSDLGSRRSGGETVDSGQGTMRRVAILQHASQAVLDSSREGLLAGLAESGWVEGKNLNVRIFNAEADLTVAQAMGKEMATGDFDLLLSISTPSLQVVANANRSTRIPHVFGIVTDPMAAGVGIIAPNDHPAWMAGYGTMQPVDEAFVIVREMNPRLKTVGVIFNAGEANAVAQIARARKVCAEAGIALSETTVDNAVGVGEAAAALVSRGVEAIWVCGDVTVMTAIDSVMAAAGKGGIPVFTVVPPNVSRGALFDLGADYREVGRLTGLLAGDVLNGKDPAGVVVENVMPEMLTLNLQVAGKLGNPWSVPEDIKNRARLTIDADGTERVAEAPPSSVTANPNPTGKKWHLALLLYSETAPSEETLDGMAKAWEESLLKEGRDYTISLRSAQGDMAAIGGLIDAAVTDGADLIVPLSTPAMQNTIHKVSDRPVVFSLVADPVAAGAGKSYTDHLPNVTGVAVLGPFNEMLDLLETYYPKYKRIGTLFCPAEVNSVVLKDLLEESCRERGFTLVSVAANSSGEMADAALSLASQPIDAIVQISDNLSSAGFVAISKAARQARMPLFSLNSTTVPQGAPIAMGRDYFAAGEATVKLIEEVIAGKSPGEIPFILPPKVLLTISLPNARALDMKIPEGLREKADVVID